MTIEITDLESLQKVLESDTWKQDRKTQRAVWDYVRSARVEKLNEIELPSPHDGVVECRVSREDVAALTARVKASSGRGGKFFGTFEPPKPSRPAKATHQQPTLPFVWFTPAMASWITEVVLGALRSRAGSWASILNLPDRMTAQEFSRIVASRVPEMEIAVRDTAIWARWSGARV